VLRRIEDAGGVAYRSPRLDELGVPHLFTTRIDAGGELDLRVLDADGWARLTERAGAPRRSVVRVRQVHGNTALRIGDGPLPGADLAADALVTGRADVVLCIHVADCVPVLLAADGGRRVAAVHAGWRGLVAGVVGAAAEALGGTPTCAAIGPCLSARAFEVGPEVVAAFQDAGLGSFVEQPPEGRAHIDLRAAVAAQLGDHGYVALDSSDRCTYADAAECWSHRRDVTHGGRPNTGRLGALIGIARGG
jgi:YfiH family protein